VAANEAAAIKDIRGALSQQSGNPAAFMGAPITCPSPPSSFTTTKSGYVRGCTAGVYWAVPEVQGKSGIRGFGGDATGRLCATNDGTIPDMAGGCNAVE